MSGIDLYQSQSYSTDVGRPIELSCGSFAKDVHQVIPASLLVHPIRTPRRARALRAYRVAGSKRCARCKNSLQPNSIESVKRLCDRPRVTSVRNGYTEGAIEGRPLVK